MGGASPRTRCARLATRSRRGRERRGHPARGPRGHRAGQGARGDRACRRAGKGAARGRAGGCSARCPRSTRCSRALDGRARARAAIPRPRLTATVREALDAERRRLLEAGGAPLRTRRARPTASSAGSPAAASSRSPRSSTRPAWCSTPTSGRALLSPLAHERLARSAQAYSNLEMDVARKERGSRYSHVEGCCAGSPAREAALVVNNCAAAVLLALETLARGKEVIVSRGELIEIGGEFRIPDIMRRAGAVLREVGATNRTHLQGLRRGHRPRDRRCSSRCTPQLPRGRLHRRRVLRASWPSWGAPRGVPVMEDLGSGCSWISTRYGLPVRADRTGGRGLGRGPRLVLGRQAAGRPAGRHRGRARASWWSAWPRTR